MSQNVTTCDICCYLWDRTTQRAKFWHLDSSKHGPWYGEAAGLGQIRARSARTKRDVTKRYENWMRAEFWHVYSLNHGPWYADSTGLGQPRTRCAITVCYVIKRKIAKNISVRWPLRAEIWQIDRSYHLSDMPIFFLGLMTLSHIWIEFALGKKK